MPRNSAGVYSLPNGYQAVAGDTIQPSQHNPPLEDIAQALTESLPRTGAAGMIANLGMGSFRITNLGAPTDPTDAARMLDVDLVGVPVGGVIEYYGETPPTNWVFAAGQALSRSEFPLLFSRFGTRYGAGNGTTTFNVVDKRGYVGIGRDNMNGTAAGRVTTAGSGIDGTTLGAVGGSQSVTLTEAQIAAHTHGASTEAAGNHAHSGSTAGAGAHSHSGATNVQGAHQHGGGTSASGDHTHGYTTVSQQVFTWQLGSGNFALVPAAANTGAAGNHSHSITTDVQGAHQHGLTINGVGDHTHSLSTNMTGAHTHAVTVNNAGGGQAHNNMPPGIICNYILRVK